MLWLLYYWRLEKEKWFDQLILAIKELNNRKVDFEIFIFWTWSLEADLLEIQSNNVHFFWWKPLDTIKQYLPNIDYCVMPSEFLETFWLSALNALSRWLPVIWYKKWWLEPFIFQECNLFLAKWNTTSERLVYMIDKLSKKTNPEMIKQKSELEWKIQKLLPDYTEETWLTNFQDLCWSNKDQSKKILIISDFINKVGWIETYIHDVKNLLENNWYEVILWWSTLPWWRKWKWKKRLWLILTRINWWNAKKLKKILESEKPDIIWFNSLLRRLWPNTVKVAWKWRKENKSDTTFWMMYHDFWYFYAFPSTLFNIEDCKTPLTKKSFLLAWKWRNVIIKCAVFFKYIWLQPLKSILKKEIDIHLSPSECVCNISRDSYQIAQRKCKIFPHFIQR